MIRIVTKHVVPDENGNWSADSGTLGQPDAFPPGTLWLGMAWDYEGFETFVNPNDPNRQVLVRQVTTGDNVLISQAAVAGIVLASNGTGAWGMGYNLRTLEAESILRAEGNLSLAPLDPEDPEGPQVPIPVNVRFVVAIPAC